MQTIDKLIPYLLGSAFTLAMFKLFLAFSKYVERHGL